MCIVQTVAELGSRTWVFFFFLSQTLTNKLVWEWEGMEV
jgi:hypothetical protein